MKMSKLLKFQYFAGEKRISFEEFYPMYEQLSKEKEVGSFADFFEGLKVFDKDENGKVMAAELRHVLLALGKARVFFADSSLRLFI